MASVLVVDDAAFMRMVLKKIILQAGHKVIAEASNGDEAVEKYRKFRPDIVFLDIVMPPGRLTKDGIDALKIIMREDPEAKVIMCSSMGQHTLVTEALKIGAKDFVVKPFRPVQILEVLSKYS
ncbi:MAG: response regulator [archaeon GB-1867-005]|nr:response regulator [Candidatus Culexmicrobium cathedralense]